MKNLKYLFHIIIIYSILVACENQNAKNESNKVEEVIKLNSGADHATYLVKSLKIEKITLEKTTSEEIKTIFGLNINPYQMDSTLFFEGYRLDRQFNLTDDKVSSIIYSTYSEEEGEGDGNQVIKDLEILQQELKNLLGDPKEKTETNTVWVINNTSISLSSFDSGFDLNIDPYVLQEESDLDDYGESCVGDFYNLKKDLNEVFLDLIVNGTIEIGVTSKDDITKIFEAENYSIDYEGLSLSVIFLYDGGILSSITLDYLYVCDGAITFLEEDCIEITNEITNTLSITGNANEDNTLTTWKIKNQTITQTNFEDGYSITITK